MTARTWTWTPPDPEWSPPVTVTNYVAPFRFTGTVTYADERWWTPERAAEYAASHPYVPLTRWEVVRERLRHAWAALRGDASECVA